MLKVLRRLVLIAALIGSAVGASSLSAQARTAFAEGAGAGVATRSLEYVQALNESESGAAELFFDSDFGCGVYSTGAVSGSPISNGVFVSLLYFDCAGMSGTCVATSGVVEMADARGEIEKDESGTLCVTVGSDSVRLVFRGTYTIVDGFDAYSGASGTGPATKSLACDLDTGLCTMTGHEGVAAEEVGPSKKGNEPPNVLLCSPVLVKRADGSIGIALQIPWADYQAWLKDPPTHPEIPKGSIPAKYGQGIGLTCDNLPGYSDSGKKVDEQGTVPDDQTGPIEGAIYPYWAKI
jgi:hypothetical protein